MRVLVRLTLGVATMFALLASAPSLHAVDLYQSNAVGIRGARFEADAPARDEYVLEVSFVDGSEVSRLLLDGKEVQRIEVTRDGTSVTEDLYRDGLLESSSVRRDNGIVLSERHYSDGLLTERWEFSYQENSLTGRESYGPGDDLVYRESYFYWRDGTLRSMIKAERSETRTEYRYRDGRLEEEWVSRPGEAERFEFDSAGRLVIRELFADDELVEQEVRLYWGADSGSLLKQVVVSVDEEITRRGYDERGRLTSERVEESGEIVRQLTRSFGGDLLVSEIEKDQAGERQWEYDYTTDGERERTTYRENGQVVEVSYLVLDAVHAPADRMTELYNRGAVVLRVYYEGQLRLREEVIRDGEVIRTRELGVRSGDS